MTTTRHVLREGPGAEQSNSDLSQKLNEWLTRAGPTELFRTCGTCNHMARDVPAHCSLYGMTPPVDVVLSGCERYVDEAEPPFPT